MGAIFESERAVLVENFRSRYQRDCRRFQPPRGVHHIGDGAVDEPLSRASIRPYPTSRIPHIPRMAANWFTSQRYSIKEQDFFYRNVLFSLPA